MSEAVRTLYSWSRGEYERIVDAGAFPAEARLELLDGEIIDMSPQESTHAAGCDLVEQALRRCFRDGFYVRAQKPLALDASSEPEPDVAVVAGGIRDYVDRHPESALLVVEVADTSLAFDRSRKAAAYARNAIAEYWILNLRERQLEVYRAPSATVYRDRTVLLDGDSIAPLAVPDCRIDVGDLLP